MNAISGYDLAQEIISKRDEDAVATMLQYAGDSESDYLELKAAVLARREDLQPGESPEDMYWNIAKELIAMMNTRGGLLVIGIDDKNHEPVPLKNCDPDNVIGQEGIEAYIRKVANDNIMPQNQKWKYKGMTFSVPTSQNLNHYLQIYRLNYLGENVIAYLVEPCEEGDFITVKMQWADGREAPEILPRRFIGHIGKCEPLCSVADIINHIQTRKVKSTMLGRQLDKLITSPKGFELDTLPERNTEFCGREAELEKMRELIVSEKIPILHGEAGTGKTELACEFAHRHKGQFPGGCLFLSMENVHSWPTALNMIYASRKVKQAIGHIPAQAETDRANWLFNRLISNLDRGNILVILDNMDDETALTYNELKKGFLAEHLKGPRRVCIIGTTRVLKTNFENSGREIAEVVELENLAPDAAFKLLCSRLPSEVTEDEESKKYISMIVKELGNHAWSTEISGGFLSRNFNNLQPPPLASYLKIIQDCKAGIMAAEATWRNNEMTVEELLKPTLEKLKSKEGAVGERAIALAKCIAFFPHHGVTEAPLRFIWKNLLKGFPEYTNGFDEFKRSLNLLKQYALVGNDMSDGHIRMHHLTQRFFRNLAGITGGGGRKFADMLSKTIASDPHCPPRFWAEMAKDNILMAHCPWSSLDGSATHDIVSAHPEVFSSLIDWRKLDGYDIADLLTTHPELAKRVKSFDILYHDDSESPCRAFAMLLAKSPAPFAEKCDFKRLSCRDIVYLLSRQPQLAKKCIPALKQFNRKQWAMLIALQPNLFSENSSLNEICRWDQFKANDWMRIIASKPEMANDRRFTTKYSLESFSTFKWAYLLASNPNQFKNNPACPREKIAASARATVHILSRQPSLALEKDRQGRPVLDFNFEKLSPLQWAQLLSTQPGLSKYCDKCKGWSRLTGKGWALLLAMQPNFAGRCNFSKLDGNDWGYLLVKQPQLATPDAWKCMAKQPHDEFLSPLVRVIYNHPELVANQRRDLSGLSPSGKRILLSKIPTLDDQIDASRFQPREWARLVTAAPNTAEKCPFKDINPVELAVILTDQPQLEEIIKDTVPQEKWSLTKKICEERSRALMLSDLLWHFDDARMTCNLKKLIVFSANIAWAYFSIGMARQAKVYLEFLIKCLKRCDQPPTRVSALPVANPAAVVSSISSMLDLQDPKYESHEVNQKMFANICIFIRQFEKSKKADVCMSALRAALKKRKIKLEMYKMADIASSVTRDKVSKIKAANNTLVCLNFEERLPFSFADPKKKEMIESFHKGSRFLDKTRAENLGFDHLITISPMLFCDIPEDVGDRILHAIANLQTRSATI